jgi:hypothetical protein
MLWDWKSNPKWTGLNSLEFNEIFGNPGKFPRQRIIDRYKWPIIRYNISGGFIQGYEDSLVDWIGDRYSFPFFGCI